VQKRRRAQFLEDWRRTRQTVVHGADVPLLPTARGLRTGVFTGADGDRPIRSMDALVHEIDRDAQAGDPSTVDWPELRGPSWP
jgi:gentisate 1,2-dioxygenase